MVNKEMLKQDLENFKKYLLLRISTLGLTQEKFALKVKISKSEITKILNDKRESVSLHSFYRVVVNSGDTIANAQKQIYPHRNFKLKTVRAFKKDNNLRNKFGLYMETKFETDSLNYVPSKNSLEIISQKTGITEKRLKEIYYKSGAPEPYEFLLIEKAVGKNTGEMMKDYIENYLTAR